MRHGMRHGVDQRHGNGTLTLSRRWHTNGTSTLSPRQRHATHQQCRPASGARPANSVGDADIFAPANSVETSHNGVL
jgi:hypothetical protein